MFATNDEFYCNFDPGKHKICRRCNSLDEDCEGPKENEGCKCDNMEMGKNDDSGQLYGGPKQCEGEDPFCYVYEDTLCDDAEYSSVNDRYRNIWLNGEVYYSYEACDGKNNDKIGNEEFLDGIKITKDRLKIVLDNGLDLGEDLTFYMNSHEECQRECKLRQGECGAWSFHKEEELCYLHTVNSNCGQFDKREEISDWISGYNQQNKCWSTRNDCPCDLKTRLQRLGTAHGAGNPKLHASGSLGQVASDNKCACEKFKTKRGRIRCRKPTCKADKCNDGRKCRRAD